MFLRRWTLLTTLAISRFILILDLKMLPDSQYICSKSGTQMETSLVLQRLLRSYPILD